jgi:hypothetical protein
MVYFLNLEKRILTLIVKQPSLHRYGNGVITTYNEGLIVIDVRI